MLTYLLIFLTGVMVGALPLWFVLQASEDRVDAAARIIEQRMGRKSPKRRWFVWLLVLLAGCSTPTQPTPIPPPPVVAVVPPMPPIIPAFPPADPRFDLTFYRQFAHNALELKGGLVGLNRQTQAPRIYLRTIDDAGLPLDALTLNQTAVAIENTVGLLTGVFGVAGLERGTETRKGQAGWITVRWAAVVDLAACGRAPVGGDVLTFYPKTPGCRCAGGPAVKLVTIKHELGHALGFWHTDSRSDLMHAGGDTVCDKQPSERERYHAAVAYTRAIGSLP